MQREKETAIFLLKVFDKPQRDFITALAAVGKDFIIWQLRIKAGRRASRHYSSPPESSEQVKHMMTAQQRSALEMRTKPPGALA